MPRVLEPFEYFEPETVKEAIDILAKYEGRAKLLAGGVDLIARMRRREIQPQAVVSLQRIPGLSYIEGDGKKGLRIGALTTLRSLELSPKIRKDYLLLWEAMHQIVSVQVKNMGTAVGNLCVGTPASDVAVTLLALGAELKIANLSSERTISIEDLFVGVGQTILQPDEIVTEISLPTLSTRTGGAFCKLARTAADIAKVNVAVTISTRNSKDVRIALGSVAPTIIRAKKAEEALKGQKLEPKTIREAAEAAASEAKPITDIRSTAEYRKEMTKILVRRAIEQALERTKA